MAHRTFADARGRAWEVWEVRPGRAVLGAAKDHRRGVDRRRTPAAEGAGDGRPEQRRGVDRRVAVAPPLQRGWLAFRCGGERRRLAPVPGGWELASDAALAEYCAAAVPVRRL